MTLVLPAGAKAPDFNLTFCSSTPVTLQDCKGKRVVLLFLPHQIGEELGAQLARYQEHAAHFEELNCVILAIAEMAPEQLLRLAADRQILFPLFSDLGTGVWKRYGALGSDRPIEPTAFVIDEQGLIRAVYEAARNPTLPGPLALARAVRKLNDVPRPVPIIEQDWRMGSPDAAVTLVEYSDYECHHCQEASHAIEQLLMRFGDKIQIVHRHLPLRQTHPHAQLAAEAAEAAGAQNKFWEMHRRLFAAQGARERDQLIAYAQEVGLEIDPFVKDLDTHRFEPNVNEDWRLAVQSGIKLPPSLFMNEILFEPPYTYPRLCARVESQLR